MVRMHHTNWSQWEEGLGSLSQLTAHTHQLHDQWLPTVYWGEMGISENALTPQMTGRLMFKWDNYVFILLININYKAWSLLNWSFWRHLPILCCYSVWEPYLSWFISRIYSCFSVFPQYLTCLKTSRSLTDKLSFDVGLEEDSIGNNISVILVLL